MRKMTIGKSIGKEGKGEGKGEGSASGLGQDALALVYEKASRV